MSIIISQNNVNTCLALIHFISNFTTRLPNSITLAKITELSLAHPIWDMRNRSVILRKVQLYIRYTLVQNNFCILVSDRCQLWKPPHLPSEFTFNVTFCPKRRNKLICPTFYFNFIHTSCGRRRGRPVWRWSLPVPNPPNRWNTLHCLY